MTQTTTYTHAFLTDLAAFAYSYRNQGPQACNRDGSLSRLQARAKAEGFSRFTYFGREEAVILCRELYATGKGAFEV
jgi:hypothetical protein